VAAVAQEVGYDSEAAFARAFKRLVGQPPAASSRRKPGDRSRRPRWSCRAIFEPLVQLAVGARIIPMSRREQAKELDAERYAHK
jgi:AraC-like DNA-binding protein